MIVETPAQYEQVINQLLKDKLVAIDTETEEFSKTKLHSFELALDGIGVHSEHCSAYFMSSCLDENFKKIFQQVLDKCELIFHNAKFDLTILEKAGFNISNVKFNDTMIMAWLLDENRKGYRPYALKTLAQTVLKIKKEDIVEFTEVAKKPIPEDYGMFRAQYVTDLTKYLKELGNYCMSDSKYTYELYRKFFSKIQEQQLVRVYADLEVPFIQVLRGMETLGIKIDINYLIRLGNNIDVSLMELQTEIWKLVGKNIDINSPKQLVAYFQNIKKYDIPQEFFTKKGNASSDRKCLEYFVQKYKCAVSKKILDYRELFKLRSTYVTGMLDRQKNGIIYASFKQTGAVTGRLSSSAPNLQNIPRRSDNLDIRKAFIPRENCVFVISDLSQIELRIAAYLSKDPILLKAYQEGKDVHQETADALGLNCGGKCSDKKERCTICKEGRVQAKAANFGVLYGRTAYGLSHGLGVSPEEAEKFLYNYFQKFKQLAVFIQRSANTVEHKHEVKTVLKRKRRFPDYALAKKAKDWKLCNRIKRQATNAIIQGSASDIVKIQMRNLHVILQQYDAHILIQVHDELIIECPKSNVEKVMEVVKYEMENAFKLPGIPIVTEPHIANCWEK